MQSTTLAPPLPIFAVRDFGFSISSPTIPLVEFQSGLQFTEDIEALVVARIDYNLGTSSGAFTYTDEFIPFDDDHAGNLTTEGLIQRLQLQNYLGDIFALEVPGDSFIEWAGPIVATRIIPEPSSLLLAGVLCALVFAFHRRARRFIRVQVAVRAAAVVILGVVVLLSNAHAAEFIFLGETTSAAGVSPDGSMVLVSPDNHNFSDLDESERHHAYFVRRDLAARHHQRTSGRRSALRRRHGFMLRSFPLDGGWWPGRNRRRVCQRCIRAVSGWQRGCWKLFTWQ